MEYEVEVCMRFSITAKSPEEAAKVAYAEFCSEVEKSQREDVGSGYLETQFVCRIGDDYYF